MKYNDIIFIIYRAVMQYNIIITKGDLMYVAHNLELGVVSQWDTVEQALSNIQEATELYLEDSNERIYEYNPALLTNITISSNSVTHG